MRIQREESIWVDELVIEEESTYADKGTLNLVDEFDDSGVIYMRIGSSPIGFISKPELVELAEKIIALWKEKDGSVEAKP